MPVGWGGVAMSMAVHRCCEKEGVSIPRSPKLADYMKPNESMAVGAMGTIVKKSGEGALCWVLRQLRGAYPDESNSLRANYIKILHCLYHNWQDHHINERTLQKVLSAHDFDDLIAAASGGRIGCPPHLQVAQLIVKKYNAAVPKAKALPPAGGA